VVIDFLVVVGFLFAVVNFLWSLGFLRSLVPAVVDFLQSFSCGSISCCFRFFAAAGFLWLSSSFGNWVIAVVDFLWLSIFCCCWVLVAVEFFW